MLPLGTQCVNAAGHLEIGGCDAVELAQRFGTPLYVLDEAHLRANCQAYREAFQHLHKDTFVYYATKALICIALCQVMEEEGLGLDVASAGELYTALKAGFPVERILLHGNNKTDEELRMAVEHRVGRIVVDHFDEIARIAHNARALNRTVPVMVRVTPGIKARTHDYITTGQMDTKFGFSLEAGQAMRAVEEVLSHPRLHLTGVHCHIGSQLLGLRAFEKAVEVMVAFMAEVYRRTGYTLQELNLGGGLGIRYLAEDNPPSVAQYAQAVVGSLKAACRHHGLPLPRLLLEPGRSIVGEAGVTLYTIGVVKEIPGVRTYVAVDGGLSDNPRPALYGAEYTVLLANKANQPPNTIVTVAGKHCESDILFRDVELASPRPGDILAVQSTGAYNYAMASNYNRYPRPAMVLVRNGEARVIVRRETLDDLIAHDVPLR